MISANGVSRLPSMRPKPAARPILSSQTPNRSCACLHMAARVHSGGRLRSALALSMAFCLARRPRRPLHVLARRDQTMLARSLHLRPGSGMVVQSSRRMLCLGSRELLERHLPTRRKWLPRTWRRRPNNRYDLIIYLTPQFIYAVISVAEHHHLASWLFCFSCFFLFSFRLEFDTPSLRKVWVR
jgi:hypothetical protein